jgi:iron uptake system component EfeO
VNRPEPRGDSPRLAQERHPAVNARAPRPLRRWPVLLAAPLALAVLAGCQKVATTQEEGAASPGASSGSRSVAISIADEGCRPEPASVPAGPVKFDVRNTDSQTVTEAELVSPEGRILGERENLTPGLSGTFSLELKAGTYSVYCPGAQQETSTFKVTGGTAAASSPTSGAAKQLADGVAGYRDYVQHETAQLVTATKAFTDAVRAGDVAEAKRLYGPARTHYERIEPVAESFGDLDPAIDARINDVADPSKWTGFHPLERALWEKNSAAGLKPLADKLDADVTKLDGLVKKVTYQPADLANGATSLLTEVSGSKISGEEERYSHLDLLDIWANVDGAKRAFDLLSPALQRTDKNIVTTVNSRFTTVNQTLAKHRDGTSFQSYSALSKDEVKLIANQVDALAEPLSTVAEKVVSAR